MPIGTALHARRLQASAGTAVRTSNIATPIMFTDSFLWSDVWMVTEELHLLKLGNVYMMVILFNSLGNHKNYWASVFDTKNVSFFCSAFPQSIVCSNKYFRIYVWDTHRLHVGLHVECVPLSDLTNTGMCQQIFILLSTSKCNGNSFSSDRFVLYV